MTSGKKVRRGFPVAPKSVGEFMQPWMAHYADLSGQPEIDFRRTTNDVGQYGLPSPAKEKWDRNLSERFVRGRRTNDCEVLRIRTPT